MYLYEIRNTVSSSVYVGITRSSIATRWRSHKCSANRGVKTPLYDSIRSKGVEKFTIEVVRQFTEEAEMLQAEKDLISFYRKSSIKCYNILDGGASYFPIRDMEAHRVNLKKKRVGKKPALGMKHSEENKKLFSEVSNKYWSTQHTYSISITKLSFIEANAQFGISKTHFYRLRKLAETNDLS